MFETLIIASQNTHKIQELQEFFSDLSGMHISGLDQYPGHPPLLEEGHTFEDNAHQKAEIIASFTQKPTLADDSGLEVDALNGAPGVYSARYAHLDTQKKGNATDRANNEKLLAEMVHVPKEERRARYVCVLSLIDPIQKKHWFFKGTCEGLITEAPQGTGGFGYDPLFFLPDMNCTMAQVTSEEKAGLSHRAMAFQKLKRFILKSL